MSKLQKPKPTTFGLVKFHLVDDSFELYQKKPVDEYIEQLEAENAELKELKEIMPELFDGLILLENSTQIWLECNRHNRDKSERITELFERFKQLIPWKNNKKLGASNER